MIIKGIMAFLLGLTLSLGMHACATPDRCDLGCLIR